MDEVSEDPEYTRNVGDPEEDLHPCVSLGAVFALSGSNTTTALGWWHLACPFPFGLIVVFVETSPLAVLLFISHTEVNFLASIIIEHAAFLGC